MIFTGTVYLINRGMIKAKVSPNLVSFVTVRRGNWVLKISVFKTSNVLVVGQHYFAKDQFFVRQFLGHDAAADFIDALVKEESENE